MHHNEKYDDHLPIYKAVELFTLGELSKLFDNLNNIVIKKSIIQEFRETEIKLTLKIFNSWMKIVTDIRNICAHHDILWKRKFVFKKIKKQYLDGLSDSRGRYSLFTILLIFRILILNKTVYTKSLDNLSSIFDSYADIICPESLSFPKNWRQQLEEY